MTIDQAVAALLEEKLKGLTSRFPCRAIMVRNVQQYCDLLEKLDQIPDIEHVPASELFSGPDVMPRYVNLTKPEFTNRWLVVTGVSEYLRLFSKSEAESQRFAKLWTYQAPASNTGRVIIPLWGCEAQWHDKSLHLSADLRQEGFYFNCSDSEKSEQKMRVVLLSDTFEKYSSQLNAQHGLILFGLQEWYEYWAKPEPSVHDLILMTARFHTIQPVTGSITIHVVKDTLSFIRENMTGASSLNTNICPEEAQNCLFPAALDGDALDNAILSCLNLNTFTAIDMMGKWSSFTTGQKQLSFLWFFLHPDDSYLCHCILGASSFTDMEKRILHEVFIARNTHPSWIEESQKLITAMGLLRDDTYYTELDAIPEYEERLHFLSGGTQQERVYLLHMVGLWLRDDATQVYNCDGLQKLYPALGAYLGNYPCDEDLNRYMIRYKTHKLANTLPVDEETHFDGINTELYDFRFAVLSSAISDSTVVLWIDALGVEWMPLLIWSLSQRESGQVVETYSVQSSLPTETVFNSQWEKMAVPYKKLDKLDKLSHKGIVDEPDYYVCIEEQIRFIISIVDRVEELLKEYHRVIITGDHGTSRLAARFFHKRDGVPVPKGGKACSHGRYALIQSGDVPLTPVQTDAKDDDGNQYIVFVNYDHFVQSGFAAGIDDENAVYGEVHGGGTPEEILVPVIVYDSYMDVPLTASWKKNSVRISKKKAKLILCFNRTVHNLQVSAGTNQAEVNSAADEKEWTVTFSELSAGTHNISVVADGKLIPVEPIKVMPAIMNEGGDLP